MAEKRMFAKTIVLSDSFLDMPMSARCLYFTLSMLADDEGFVSSPKAIMRQCGASVDDLKVLISKKYVICFESGIIVITHWRINNYLRKDRYVSTTYLDEKGLLAIDKKGAYYEVEPTNLDAGIPHDGQTVGNRCTQYSNSIELEKNTLPPLPPKGGKNHKVDKPDDSDLSVFTGELLEAVRDWFAYKNEKRQSYKPTGRKTLLKQIRAKADEYGEMNVAALIRDSMASNYQGIVWDRLGRRQTRASSAPVEYGDPAEFYK